MADLQEQEPQIAPGQKLLNDAIGAGYSRDEADAWKAKKYSDGLAAGYPLADMKKYFGDDKEPSQKPMIDHFKRAIDEANPKPEAKPGEKAEPREANTWLESFQAGVQSSVTGLDLRKSPPDITPNQHADLAQRILQQAGQTLGDFPEMVVGGGLGGLVGGFVGGAASANPVVAVGTGAAGAAYGTMALPEAMRTWMIDGYKNGEIRSASDFAARVVHASWEAHKQGLVSALTAGVGSVVKPLAGPIGALVAEVPAMTVAGAAVQGRTPEPHEFLDAAVMVTGLHAATGGFSKGSTADKLANIYDNTGNRPDAVIEHMHQDVVFNQEMHSENPDLPAQAKAREEAPTEQTTEPPVEPPRAATAEGEPPTPEDLVKKFNGYIGETPAKETLPFAQRVSEGFDQKYAEHMDSTVAMQHAMDAVNADPNNEENPRVLARLFAAHQDTLKKFIEEGTRDWKTGTVNGESFKAIQQDYEKAFPDDPNREIWKAVGIAERALEKSEQKSASGKVKEISVNGEKINLTEAKQLVDAHPEIQQFIDRRTKYGNKVLEYGRDAGLFSQKQFKAMIDANLHYTDLNRLMEPDDMTGKTKGSKDVKELFGEGGLFQDPMLNWLKNTDAILRMAAENEIKSKLVDQVALTVTDAEGNTTPHPDAWLRKVETDMRPIKIEAEELNKGLKAQGIELNDETLEGMTIFRPAEKRLGPNRIERIVDGKREVYEGPSALIDSVNALKGNKTNMDVFGQILKGFSAVERTTTVGTPWFAFKHAWRQQISAGTFSKYGYSPFADFVKTAWQLKTSPETQKAWSNFFYDGGAVSSLKAFDNTWLQSEIYKLDKETPFMNKVWNKVENVVNLSHWMIVNHDNLIRFNEYQGALKAGEDRTSAAFAAREVLPDFQKAGLKNAFLFQQTAFLKVHLQGLDRMAQAVGEDVTQYKETGLNANNNIIRGIMGITLPHILLAAANWGDKDIEQLEPFQRYGYFNVPIDRWQPTTGAQAAALKGLRDDLIRDDGKGGYLYNNKIMARVQNPFTQGIIFGGVADAALKSMQDKSPQAMKDWLWNVAGSTVADAVPNFAKAAYSQSINYESFTGRPVVTLAKEKLLPEMQYDQYTSETAKTIGKIIQAVPFVGDLANQIGPAGRKVTSPMVIDMYIRETTGTMGQLMVSAVDKGLQKAGLSEVKNEPEPTLADYPIIREFVWRHPSMKAESITQFTEAFDDANRISNSIRAKMKEAAFNPAAGGQALAMQQQYADQLLQRLAGPHEAIRNMAQTVQGLRLMPGMGATEKRQLTDQLYYRMVQISQQSNKQIDEMKKMMKNNINGGN